MSDLTRYWVKTAQLVKDDSASILYSDIWTAVVKASEVEKMMMPDDRTREQQLELQRNHAIKENEALTQECRQIYDLVGGYDKPCSEAVKAKLEALKGLLPSTFYTDRALADRITLLVQGWQKSVESSKQIDTLITRLVQVEERIKITDRALFKLVEDGLFNLPDGVRITIDAIIQHNEKALTPPPREAK